MEYARKEYLEKLIAGMGSDQVKIITGIRRCGKSYLLNTIFKRCLLDSGVPRERIIEMDFDGYRSKEYRDPKVFLDFIDKAITDSGRYYVLLDEVQLLGSFTEVLNELIHMGNVDVYATGSNARLLSKDIVTEFRGRGDEIAMRPLSFSEFMEGYEGDKRDGYTEYAMYGGLPAVAMRKDTKRKTDYLSNVFNETYIADIIDRNGVQYANDLEQLVNVLCSNISGLTNPTKIANTFKSSAHCTISRQTVEKYLGYLEDSFLFEKAVRYDVKGRRYIGADAKYYAIDTGLRNARMNFRQFEETHLLENIIYNELRGRGYGVDVGVVPAQRKDADGKWRRAMYEIDFVCNSGSERCYIQSALALPDREKLQQEQASLMKVDDSFRKVIITKEGFEPHYNENGILMMNVYDFLLDRHALRL